MESQRQVPLRKKDRFGFVGKNLAVVSSVQRTKDIHFNEPSKPGEAPMTNSRIAMNIVSLQDFVLSKTYRKRATVDRISRVRTVKTRVPFGCGLTRIKLRNQILITGSRQQ